MVDIREVDAIYGLKYTLKYLKKAPTVSGHVDEYNEVLKGTRLVQAWGSWYGEVRAKEKDEGTQAGLCGLWTFRMDRHTPESVRCRLKSIRGRREVNWRSSMPRRRAG